MPGCNYTYITTATTTTIAGNDSNKRICVMGISFNKALAGTVTIKSGASTTIGIFAAATAAGMQWYPDGGIEVADLRITNASGEDITVFWTNL